MDLRPYQPSDRAPCLEVFDSLLPESPDPEARTHFELWLDRPDGKFFVMEHDGSIVGCGGYSFSPDQSIATLCWGMVRRASQRMGLGRFLLMYRIREIGRDGAAGMVLAQVPQASAAFYQKQGFRINEVREDGSVEMIKKLSVCP